ncbi:MAG: translocation/assembly module TamB domain-containing protein [Candidatus Eisenbacteria bacterium]
MVAPNDWIEEFRALFESEAGAVLLDTVAIVLAEGAGLRGSGRFSERAWQGKAVLDIEDLRFLDRFRPGAEGSADAAIRAEIVLSGDRSAPRLEASWKGRVVSSSFRADEMTGRIDAGRTGWSAEARAPSGGHGGPLLFDDFDLFLRSASDSDAALFPAEARLHVRGPDYELLQRSVVSGGDGWSVRVESLAVRLDGQEAVNRRPFDVRIGPEPGTFGVSGLELAGGLGAITAEGGVGTPGTGLFVEAGFSLPERPEGIRVPDGLWPRRIEAVLHAPDGDHLIVNAGVGGIVWAGLPVQVNFEFEGGDGEGKARLGLSREGGERLRVEGRAPMDAGLYPYRFGLRGGDLSVTAEFTDFPVALPREGGEETVRAIAVNGRAALGGTVASPTAEADLKIRAPLRAESPPLTGEFRAKTEGSGTTGRIEGTLAVHSSGSPWFDGEFSWPAGFSLLPARFVVRKEEAGSLHARSDGLPLGEIAPYLPSDFGMEGRVRFDVAAEGPVSAPTLRGDARATGVKATLPDGSWISTDAGIEVSGTAGRPALEGEFVVSSGVLRIPDKTRTLHPAGGGAILWGLRGEEGDDGEGEPKKNGGPAGEPRAARPLDLDVTVSIPSGVWIRGQGLDAELAGELRLVQKGAYPTLTGELSAVSGRFLFLGHTFLVERGRVVFYGDDEANPTLDLVLAANVQGTSVRVRFQGTAKEPELALESDPEMPEGDILSFLVFGRPVDELDNDQMGLLQRRATEVATSFGMAEIESRLARQLGVDMVTIRRGRNGGKGNSVMIGKYITRKVLLKYEQALENRESFYVNLEYFLSRHLKVETLFGHQNQSGAELTWSADY